MNFHDSAKAEQELLRAIASGNAESIARTTVDNIWPLFNSHFELLRSAVESLPNSVLDRRPILRALHPMTPVLARTTRPFKPLMSPDEARIMTPDELDVLTLVQIIAFRASGDVAASLIYARRLEDRIAFTKGNSRDRIDGPLWFYHYQIGSTLLAAGESSRALLQFTIARELGRLSLQEDAERLVLARTALAYAVRGSLSDAEATLAEAALQPQSTIAHRESSVTAERTAAALIGVERMVSNVDELLSNLEPYDSIAMSWPLALLVRARSLLARLRPDEALEAVCLARDAHPPQHGSFASDVISSVYLEALWGVGDATTAQNVIEAQTKPGMLTLSAIVRVSLHQSRTDLASSALRRLEQSRNLGPGQHANLLLLSAWHEMVQSGTLHSATVRQIWRLGLREDSRRLLATMPAQLIELTREGLSADEVAAFDQATEGLAHVDVQRRPVLTGSELRVLNALPVHATTADMAMSFHVSPNTIKSQLSSLYRKLGCSTRDEAVAIASRFHLFAHAAE
ncbi:LuxR C-terminal-related transcriptional regulator [Microbacterium sp. A93]